MMKPTIPAEVADAIEWLRSSGESNGDITRLYWADNVTSAHRKALRSIPFDTLMEALVNGYIRDMTPEERAHAEIREAYNRWYDTGFSRGILFALEKLGVEIDGVR